jgi:hypothetical protein
MIVHVMGGPATGSTLDAFFGEEERQALSMDHFSDQMQLQTFSVAGAFSWMFVLGFVVKIATTATGLLNRAKPFLTGKAEGANWWGSKVSALMVCSSAFALSWLGNDVGGIAIFGGLFVLALPLVLWLAVRRTRVVSSELKPQINSGLRD